MEAGRMAPKTPSNRTEERQALPPPSEQPVAERTAALSRTIAQLQKQIRRLRRVKRTLAGKAGRLRKIFDRAPIGIGLRDMQDRFLEGNPAMTQMLGYSQKDLRSMNLGMIIHSEDEPARQALFQELVEGKKDFYQLDLRFFSNDRGLRWGRLHDSLVRGVDGKSLYSLVMIQDITREKQAEAELALHRENLRSLASELALTEERERRRLAEFLHDEISQPLALAKIKLASLQGNLSDPCLIQQAEEVQELLGQAIHLTRNLTSELSLPVLHENGLVEAVEWLAEQFQEKYGISVCVNRNTEPMDALPEGVRVLLFRSVNELLTNVGKHAQARRAEISFWQDNDYLYLEIADNGIGFDVSSFPTRGRGFGLFSVRERLRHLGGVLKVNSAPGQGTRMTITVPRTGTEDSAPVW
jgi:PAS domain S-box-containing protein